MNIINAKNDYWVEVADTASEGVAVIFALVLVLFVVFTDLKTVPSFAMLLMLMLIFFFYLINLTVFQ